MKILAIGVHPDDIELGWAGTVSLLNNRPNAEVFFYY